MRILLLLLVACSVQAQETYPAKSVRLIAAAAPGGNPDVLARMVAAEQVARAAPDGHTLMLGDSGALAINVALNPKLTYHPLKDFTLITALAAVPTVLVLHPSLNAGNLQEYITQSKSRQ